MNDIERPDVFAQYAALYDAYLALITGNTRQRVKIGTDSREVWMHRADAPVLKTELSRLGALCWRLDPVRADREGVMQRAGCAEISPYSPVRHYGH